MTPKEKAKHLTKCFLRSKPLVGSYMMINTDHAKQCALICVNEILDLGTVANEPSSLRVYNYYSKVKIELNKL